jgi:hypothetical protein
VSETLSRASGEQRETAEVLRWRFERLLETGYDSVTASSIAGRMEIDLHLAMRLVRDGCPPQTALRILV